MGCALHVGAPSVDKVPSACHLAADWGSHWHSPRGEQFFTTLLCPLDCAHDRLGRVPVTETIPRHLVRIEALDAIAPVILLQARRDSRLARPVRSRDDDQDGLHGGRASHSRRFSFASRAMRLCKSRRARWRSAAMPAKARWMSSVSCSSEGSNSGSARFGCSMNNRAYADSVAQRHQPWQRLRKTSARRGAR